MNSVWGLLGAFAVLLVPLAMAWLVVGRGERRRRARPAQGRHSDLPAGEGPE